MSHTDGSEFRLAFQRSTWMTRLTDAEYDELLAYQGGGCAVCSRPPMPDRRLAEDHDHKTGASRGLLCTWCNRYLVGNKSAAHASLFFAAGRYLEYPPAQHVFPGRTLPNRKRRRRTRRKK